MTDEARTIDLAPTWTEAAQIIAAVLENGTELGRNMAREELFRLAAILDQQNANAPRTVFEVIASRSGNAYGVTFSNEPAAQDYAARLAAHGYTVDGIGDVPLKATAAEGYADAGAFFADGQLMEPGQ